MAHIEQKSGVLRVTFSRGEKLLGLLRDVDIPISAIEKVDLVDDALSLAIGLRAPGLEVPNRRKIGTWRYIRESRWKKMAVSVRAGEPAVYLQLRGHSWDKLLIGQSHASRLVRDIVSAAG